MAGLHLSSLSADKQFWMYKVCPLLVVNGVITPVKLPIYFRPFKGAPTTPLITGDGAHPVGNSTEILKDDEFRT